MDGRTSACSVEGCHRLRRNKTSALCASHYARQHRHGDVHAGRTDNGEPHLFLVETVLPFEGDGCLFWPYARDGHGYARINRDGRVRIVSRIVCESVKGPPPTSEHQAAHSCGKGQSGCVSPAHLRWATQSENEADKLLHGTRRAA